MEEIFNGLTNAVAGSAFVALFASFAWGILSIVLSPCHLSSIPLIIGFIDDNRGQSMTTMKAFTMSLLFSIGILSSIAIIGIITAFMGRMMGDIGSWTNYIIGIMFLLVGLYLMGFISTAYKGANISDFKRKGYFASFLLGLIFGVALGPCTFAYMAPILAIVVKIANENFVYALGLLFSYGIGHCVIILIAGTFTGALQKYLNWNQNSKAGDILKKICGFFVLLGGFWLLYTAQ